MDETLNTANYLITHYSRNPQNVSEDIEHINRHTNERHIKHTSTFVKQVFFCLNENNF